MDILGGQITESVKRYVFFIFGFNIKPRFYCGNENVFNFSLLQKKTFYFLRKTTNTVRVLHPIFFNRVVKKLFFKIILLLKICVKLENSLNIYCLV